MTKLHPQEDSCIFGLFNIIQYYPVIPYFLCSKDTILITQNLNSSFWYSHFSAIWRIILSFYTSKVTQYLTNHDENIIIFIANDINCYWFFRLCLSRVGRFFDQHHKLASSANLYKLALRSLVTYPQSPLIRLFESGHALTCERWIPLSKSQE